MTETFYSICFVFYKGDVFRDIAKQYKLHSSFQTGS